ncbi:MAG TPA: hypothetical protein HA362_06055 [Nanoarchaeota archaeon]|nr:hypothetical protein [Nanoarchaeota archaeon]
MAKTKRNISDFVKCIHEGAIIRVTVKDNFEIGRTDQGYFGVFEKDKRRPDGFNFSPVGSPNSVLGTYLGFEWDYATKARYLQLSIPEVGDFNPMLSIMESQVELITVYKGREYKL